MPFFQRPQPWLWLGVVSFATLTGCRHLECLRGHCKKLFARCPSPAGHHPWEHSAVPADAGYYGPDGYALPPQPSWGPQPAPVPAVEELPPTPDASPSPGRVVPTPAPANPAQEAQPNPVPAPTPFPDQPPRPAPAPEPASARLGRSQLPAWNSTAPQPVKLEEPQDLSDPSFGHTSPFDDDEEAEEDQPLDVPAAPLPPGLYPVPGTEPSCVPGQASPLWNQPAQNPHIVPVPVPAAVPPPAPGRSPLPSPDPFAPEGAQRERTAVPSPRVLGRREALPQGASAPVQPAANRRPDAPRIVPASVRGSQALDITRLEACRKVAGYDELETVNPQTLVRGQPVLLYAALDHFESEITAQGFRTQTFSTVDFVRPDGEVVGHDPLGSAVDLSVTQRQQFYLTHHVRIPQDLPSGDYILRLKVADLANQSVAVREIRIHVL